MGTNSNNIYHFKIKASISGDDVRSDNSVYSDNVDGSNSHILHEI